MIFFSIIVLALGLVMGSFLAMMGPLPGIPLFLEKFLEKYLGQRIGILRM